MSDTQPCPVCYLEIYDNFGMHLAAHSPRSLADHLIVARSKQQTQAATIQDMSRDLAVQYKAGEASQHHIKALETQADRQQTDLNIERAKHTAATREIATLRQTIKRLEVETAVAQDEAASLYESLQGAVNRLANVEAERDQALEEAAAAKQAHQNGATLMRNQQYNLVAQCNETAARSRAWYDELQATRKQLAQVLEQVAGARFAVNKALAVGEVDAAHLAGLNGYDRAPTPVGPWADDPALYNSVGDMADYVTGYQNAHRDPLAVAYAAAVPNGVADDTAATESTPAGAEPILPPGWSLAPDGQLTTRSTLVERTVKCGECGGEFLKIAFPLDGAALPSVFCGTCRHHVATLAPEHVSSTGGPCYLLDMEAGTLYPPATRDTVNPLSAVACPACKNRELKIFINEHEQGYVSCAECSQLIGNLFEHSNARRYV